MLEFEIFLNSKMLSLKKNEDGKHVAVIRNDKTNKVEEVLYIVERQSYRMVEDPELLKTLAKYTNRIEITEDEANDEELVSSFTLKPGFSLVPVPPEFTPDGNNQRQCLSITGKSGSGKSFFTAQWVNAYHYMYPKDLIYYVSANKIETDPSYSELLKKASFKEVLIAVDVRKINSQLSAESYPNSLFIFDDIMDVKISLEPTMLATDYRAEKLKTFATKEKARVRRAQERVREKAEQKGLQYKAPTKAELEALMRIPDEDELALNLSDNTAIAKLNEFRAKQIRMHIQNTIHDFLKRGRKYGVSLVTIAHRMFDRDDTAQCSLDESHGVVLFPYANTSREKLVEYLRTKLCFDLTQARAVADKVYKQFEFLYIGTNGKHFFMTSNHFEFL